MLKEFGEWGEKTLQTFPRHLQLFQNSGFDNMDDRSLKSLRDTATALVVRLHSAGFTAFWVGGCVRDFLLGRDPDDYDIATAALPAQVEKLFPRTFAVGKKFGVMVVVQGE